MYPKNQPGAQVTGDLEIQFRTSPIYYAESNPSLLEGPMILGVGSFESIRQPKKLNLWYSPNIRWLCF